MMKKLICLLLVLLFLLPAGAAARAEGAENNTAATEFIEISDLDGMLAIVHNPEANYLLTADIDMAGVDWKPIPFAGIFDGAGHTLYNLTITGVGDEMRLTKDGNLKPYDTFFAGLFSVLEGATIIDLKIVGASLSVDAQEHCFVGLLAGYMFQSSIQGCSVQGKVRLNNYAVQSGVAGLVGYGAGDFGYCRADVELIFEDRNLESRCEQFMGGILACGLVNIEDCVVHIQGYDSCHGYVHNGGLVGMYYYCGMQVRAQSVRRNEIYGQISFFEDNPDRRAYCKATIGEELSVPGNYYSNKSEFQRNETRDVSKVLLPETCAEPDVVDTVTSPTCDSWGYVTHTCSGCGYTWVDTYFPPQHQPGDWEIVEDATEEKDGLRVRYCSVCGKLVESESYAYEPPKPLYTEEVFTVRGVESSEVLGVQYRGSAAAMHSEEALAPLVWSCDDPEIASVDQDGVIQGLKRGTATVHYVSADGLCTGTCEVHVYYSFWQWVLIILCFGWIWYV